MHDAGIGRHDAEVVEGSLRPAEQRIALLVALKFEKRDAERSADPYLST